MKREKPMSGLRSLLLCVVLVFLPALFVAGRPSPPPADLLDKLQLGGYVIVMRHGATDWEVANKDPMSNPNNKTIIERQLNEQGREQARSIGKVLHELGIPIGSVMTSPLQRTVDTGTLLGFGEVSTNPDLAEAGSAASSEEHNRRADALRQLVGCHLAADGNLVIVTHKPNLVEAFGRDWSNVREGEASVFEPNVTGAGYRIMARIQASEWSRLAKASGDEPEVQTRGLGSLRSSSPHYD
jgi:broad specificity phosphatase PhoE